MKRQAWQLTGERDGNICYGNICWKNTLSSSMWQLFPFLCILLHLFVCLFSFTCIFQSYDLWTAKSHFLFSCLLSVPECLRHPVFLPFLSTCSETLLYPAQYLGKWKAQHLLRCLAASDFICIVFFSPNFKCWL